MRFLSTPESADKQEPTALAIFETTLGVIALLALVYWRGSAWVLVPPLLLVPIVLMSTPRAGLISVGHYNFCLSLAYNNLFGKSGNSIDKTNNSKSIIYLTKFFIIYFPIVIVLTIFCRISGAFIAFFHHPIRSFKTIPTNFLRMVLGVDFRHYPEIFRGIENKRSIIYRSGKFTKTEKLGFSHALKRDKDTLYNRLLFLFLMFFIYMPTLLYRLSIKSSALFWLPIIWIASRVREAGTAKLRIAEIRTKPPQPAMRIWSGVVLLMFSAKLLLWWRWEIWRDRWNAYFPDDFSLRLTNQLVWPDGLPLWHIATVVSAILSLGLWLWACRIDFDLKHHVKISDRRVNNVINMVNTIRTAITCYILACTVYIVVSTVLETKFPIPDIIIAPWSERGDLPVSRPLMDSVPSDKD